MITSVILLKIQEKAELDFIVASNRIFSNDRFLSPTVFGNQA